MSNCRSCKYWKPDFSGEEWHVHSLADLPREERLEIEEQLQGEVAWGEIRDWYYWGDCELADIGNYEEESILDIKVRRPKSLALAFDGSDDIAGLKTRYNFGCVQYAARTPAAAARGARVGESQNAGRDGDSDFLETR